MIASAAAMALVAAVFSILGTRWAAAQTSFSILNNCTQTVWIGSQPNSGSSILASGGFALPQAQSSAVTAPAGWGGRFWGRTGCTFDGSGAGSCLTGDCGNVLACNGTGGKPPATLAEIKLGSKDFYDISLVDGFNLPLRIAPAGGTGDCRAADCSSDVNAACPAELQVKSSSSGQVVACDSACDHFNSPQYCCTGSYGSPSSCPPTAYSRTFKTACPNAYSYAYDDGSSTFTCSGSSSYTLTFCP